MSDSASDVPPKGYNWVEYGWRGVIENGRLRIQPMHPELDPAKPLPPAKSILIDALMGKGIRETLEKLSVEELWRLYNLP